METEENFNFGKRERYPLMLFYILKSGEEPKLP